MKTFQNLIEIRANQRDSLKDQTLSTLMIRRLLIHSINVDKFAKWNETGKQSCNKVKLQMESFWNFIWTLPPWYERAKTSCSMWIIKILALNFEQIQEEADVNKGIDLFSYQWWRELFPVLKTGWCKFVSYCNRITSYISKDDIS